MIATLLVRMSAPPSPSIWRGSGLPKSARMVWSRAARSAGRSAADRNTPLLVPPRISTHLMAACSRTVRTPLRRHDLHGARRAFDARRLAAAAVRQAHAGALDLPAARRAAQLADDLDDLRDAGRAERMALAEQAAARIDRQAAADVGVAALERRGIGPRGVEAQALDA